MSVRTDEERRFILESIEESREEGLSVRDAAEDSGISASTYYAWCRKFQRVSSDRGEDTSAGETDTINSVRRSNRRAGGAQRRPPRRRTASITERSIVINRGNWTSTIPPKDIDNPLVDPLRGICLIRARFQRGAPQSGTGWFINARTVVTAGHVLFNHSLGFARQVWLAPAFSKSLPDPTPIDEISVRTQAIRVHSSWENQEDPRFDFGVIKLPSDIFAGNIFPFRFLSPSDSVLKSRPIYLSGYPVSNKPRQRLFSGKFEIIKPKRVFYRLDTSAGMSGSPIWILNQSEEPTVIALHTGLDQYARGVRIDQEVKSTLEAWKV